MLLRIVLTVLGLGFIVLGFIDAATLVQGRRKSEPPILGSTDPESWAELVRAVVELIKASPRWLLLILAGVALIVLGFVV